MFLMNTLNISFQGGLFDSHSVGETCALLRSEVLLHSLILNTVTLLFTAEHVEKLPFALVRFYKKMAGLFRKGIQIVGSLILKGIITFMFVFYYENWRSHKIFYHPSNHVLEADSRTYYST